MKNKRILIFFKYLILFTLGGILYLIIELLYRQWTHMSMFPVSGFAFVLIGLINEMIPWEMALWKQMFVGSITITVIEFISGCFINLWLKWNVWDYSDIPFNILGQICLPFSIIWLFISLLCIVADDYLRYWFFNEEKPYYKLF